MHHPGHHPGEFKVVGQAGNSISLFAMCICGDDNCGFSTTAPINTAVRLVTCKACHGGDNADGDVRTFWSTAEACGVEPGMYHDRCFWDLSNRPRLQV